MPLPQIQFANGGLDKWMWDHWNDHLEIWQAILKQKSSSLTQWPIFPFTPESPESWARMHQQAHSDMNGALGLSGTNLQQVDFDNQESADEFYDNNFVEHSNAREALGI